MKKYLFILFWLILGMTIAIISLVYKNSEEALVAVVESQETVISFQRPVIVNRIEVITGQEVSMGDTLVLVERPDLNLDIERKENELDRLEARLRQVNQEFESKKTLITIEKEGKLNKLLAERAEVESAMSEQDIISRRLFPNAPPTLKDSLWGIRMEAINLEIGQLSEYYRSEVYRRDIMRMDELELIKKEVELTNQELASLFEERNSLIKVAKFDGVIGVISIQLDELVPPFKSLLSVYEAQPSLIKAYISEEFASPVVPGDAVWVVSENRTYRIQGIVQEMGARITSYPTKIQPISGSIRYGQEVFIQIPQNNRFLNGEKVLVYPNPTQIQP